MTLLRKGDQVHVFDPAQPDAETPLRTVARVSSRKYSLAYALLWLDDERGQVAQWYADGSKRRAGYFGSRPPLSLVLPTDLPAARERAKQDLAKAAALKDTDARVENIETLSPLVSVVRTAETLPAQHVAMAQLRRALDVILEKGATP